ncbi:hypothetical protein O6P43_013225 [Quillaja saponaria]|uniref:Uncharacterized protein n=1 Tax=Quillaja saponaria TaxID=32244 RepID=A0AAD7M3D4_QUISA|nr:hypothetical protein O6P43_013225 [Quillaja saponaria]
MWMFHGVVLFLTARLAGRPEFLKPAVRGKEGMALVGMVGMNGKLGICNGGNLGRAGNLGKLGSGNSVGVTKTGFWKAGFANVDGVVWRNGAAGKSMGSDLNCIVDGLLIGSNKRRVAKEDWEQQYRSI